jgi:putative toxin-antitoxin system antitoxin component (TIGR02293 family)
MANHRKAKKRSPAAATPSARVSPFALARKKIDVAGFREVVHLVLRADEVKLGVPKARASELLKRVAATSTLPFGKVRAGLISDSSWKRAGETLGPQASETAARLAHVLGIAVRVWGNETDATEWLNTPHPELKGATPFSLLKSESGGRAVEALLVALEFGFSA